MGEPGGVRDGVPRDLGRYRLVREIGRGAMGTVYLATDPVIGRPVALKTVRVPAIGDGSSGPDEIYERFAREARTAGILSHPNIVTVYDAGRSGGTDLCYIAMELVAGRTLKQEMAVSGPLREDRALRVARAIAAALAHAHARGIVHRDLKPANILLGEDGSVKLADFGVARVEASELTRDGQTIGSPAYMSPEQVRGRAVDRRSDLFSLGVVIYEMLSGSKPFPGADPASVTYGIVHEEPPALSGLGLGLPPRWDLIVARLMRKRPEDRYPDASSLLVDLEALAAGAPARESGAVDETVAADGSGAPAAGGRSPAGDRAGAPFPFPVPGLERLGERFLRGLARSRRRLSRLSGRRKAGLALAAGALLLILGPLGSILGGGSRVEVHLEHGLASGRLRIEVDGSPVLTRRLTGQQRATRLFGREMFRRSGGTLSDSFVVRPGEHEVRVSVDSGEGDGAWSRAVRRTFAEGEDAILEIRVGKGLVKGLRLDWTRVERASPE
ncbi:MAG: serine/threonine-protein kinase [Acidobacteriota bacterium]